MQNKLKIYPGDRFVVALSDIHSMFFKAVQEQATLSDNKFDGTRKQIIVEYKGNGFFRDIKSGILFLCGVTNKETSIADYEIDKHNKLKLYLTHGFISIPSKNIEPLKDSILTTFYQKLLEHPLILRPEDLQVIEEAQKEQDMQQHLFDLIENDEASFDDLFKPDSSSKSLEDEIYQDEGTELILEDYIEDAVDYLNKTAQRTKVKKM